MAERYNNSRNEAIAWLIERGQPEGHVPAVWWVGDVYPLAWSADALKAVRFVSKEAAEQEIAKRSSVVGAPFGRATEHVFLTVAPTPDLIESRISEIRERLAVDVSAEHDEFKRRLAVYAIDLVDGFDSLDAEQQQLCSDVASWCQQRMAEVRSDLEALLAEREGMKAEIEEQRDELSSYAEEHEMLRIILGCADEVATLEQARRIMGTLDSLRDRLSAPLDPSSAPKTHDADCCCAECVGNHCCGDLTNCGYQCSREGWVPAGSGGTTFDPMKRRYCERCGMQMKPSGMLARSTTNPLYCVECEA